MRLSSMLWILVIVCAASALYAVKYRVQAMDEEIAVMKTQIEKEHSALHVLNAEWAFLSRPERIRKLVNRHLSLQEVSGQQMIEVADIPSPEDNALHLARSETAVPDAPHSAPDGDESPGLQPVAHVQPAAAVPMEDADYAQ